METDKKVAVSAEAPEPSQMSLDAPGTETNGTRKKDTKAPAKAAEAKEQVTEQPPSEVTERSRSARTEQGRSPRPERTRPEQRRASNEPRRNEVTEPRRMNNPATKTPNNSQKSSDRSPPNPTKNS